VEMPMEMAMAMAMALASPGSRGHKWDLEQKPPNIMTLHGGSTNDNWHN